MCLPLPLLLGAQELPGRTWYAMQYRYANCIPEGREEARKDDAWDAETDRRLALGVSTVLGERAYRKKGQTGPLVLKRVIERGVRVPSKWEDCGGCGMHCVLLSVCTHRLIC